MAEARRRRTPTSVAVRRATANDVQGGQEGAPPARSATRSRRPTARSIAATATGAPDRIDDETRGIPIATRDDRADRRHAASRRAPATSASSRTRVVDAFYHQLCPTCAAMSHAKRDARTDLTGKRALLTGGRAKIGMYIALRLLRDGAHTTITTRFPRDAVRRFSSLPDSRRVDRPPASRRHRPARPRPGDRARRGRRGAGTARHPDQQRDPDRAPLPRRVLSRSWMPSSRRCPTGPLPELVTFGHTNDQHPQALERSVTAHPILARRAAERSR